MASNPKKILIIFLLIWENFIFHFRLFYLLFFLFFWQRGNFLEGDIIWKATNNGKPTILQKINGEKKLQDEQLKFWLFPSDIPENLLG